MKVVTRWGKHPPDGVSSALGLLVYTLLVLLVCLYGQSCC